MTLKQGILKIFQRTHWRFAANGPNGLVAFCSKLSAWMKAWEIICPVYQIIGPESRVKPLLLLGLGPILTGSLNSSLGLGWPVQLLAPHLWHPGGLTVWAASSREQLRNAKDCSKGYLLKR